MKKAAFLSVLILFSFLSGSASGQALRVDEKTIFIAPNGADSAQGGRESPLRTLAGVLTRLKQLRYDGDVDAMRHLIPSVKCNPCLGTASVVTLRNNSVSACGPGDR